MSEIVWGLDSYVSDSVPLSANRLVNCYFEREPQSAKGQTPLFGSPGLTSWTTLPKYPVRGLWPFGSQLYAVAGDSLYRVNRAGGYKEIGDGIDGTGSVSMSCNTTQLIVVNGVGGYILDGDNGFKQIQSPSFYSASTVQFFDEYFILDRRGTNEGFFSALADGTSYTGTDFFSAEAKPGYLLAVKENLQLLFLFCRDHIESWYDSGAADTPFQRYAGGVIERGCASPYAIINQDDAIFFLSSDRIFYRLQGNVPIRVSTHALEAAFQDYGDISDAFCFTHTIKGHKWVYLTFPTARHTWVFDISTGRWHERASRDGLGRDMGRWRANCSCEIYDKILLGDYFSGAIYQLDRSNYTEDGNPLEFLAHSTTLHGGKLPVFINRLELDMEAGTDAASGLGRAPEGKLRWSKDGGETWSATQPPRSLGTVGKRLTRQRWISLGRAYQWTFELSISDAVPRVLIATHVDSEEGMA